MNNITVSYVFVTQVATLIVYSASHKEEIEAHDCFGGRVQDESVKPG